jgi:hypothetical protein
MSRSILSVGGGSLILLRMRVAAWCNIGGAVDFDPTKLEFEEHFDIEPVAETAFFDAYHFGILSSLYE